MPTSEVVWWNNTSGPSRIQAKKITDQRWPQVLTIHLWAYALQYGHNMFNEAPNHLIQHTTPIDLFLGPMSASIHGTHIHLVTQNMCWMMSSNQVNKIPKLC